jgi:hypothetical protein
MQLPNDIDKAVEYLKQAIPEGLEAQIKASQSPDRQPTKTETSPSTTGPSNKG